MGETLDIGEMFGLTAMVWSRLSHGKPGAGGVGNWLCPATKTGGAPCLPTFTTAEWAAPDRAGGTRTNKWRRQLADSLPVSDERSDNGNEQDSAWFHSAQRSFSDRAAGA